MSTKTLDIAPVERRAGSRWVLVAGDFQRLGGMDNANLRLAEYLLDHHHPVHLVAHSVDTALAKHALVTMHRISRPAGSFLLGEPVLNWWGRKIARQVLSCWPDSQVVVNGANCLWPGINWAHYVHHAWTPSTSGSPWWSRAKISLTQRRSRNREKTAFRMARLVIANSELTRRHLIEHLSLEPESVKTVYLGSDPSWMPPTVEERASARAFFGVGGDSPIAVFVGALGRDQRKGFDSLLFAWRQLCSDPGWDVDLLVAGGGCVTEWRRRIEEMGLAARVRLLGFSDHVYKLLAAADLLVSPARYEAYGLNVQEAICRGVPAMVSVAAGVAERYPAELSTMLIPDPDNITDLAERLFRWRSRMDCWAPSFRPLGEKLRSYTWTDMARNFVSLAENLDVEGSRVDGVGEVERIGEVRSNRR